MANQIMDTINVINDFSSVNDKIEDSALKSAAVEQIKRNNSSETIPSVCAQSENPFERASAPSEEAFDAVVVSGSDQFSNSKISDSCRSTSNSNNVSPIRSPQSIDTSRFIKDDSKNNSPYRTMPSIIISPTRSKSNTPERQYNHEDLNQTDTKENKNKLLAKKLYENPADRQETECLLVTSHSNVSSFSKPSQPDSIRTSTTSLERSRLKSESEDDEQQEHHVQFQKEDTNTLKVNKPELRNLSVSSDSSSSSSDFSSSSESIEISETRPPDGGWGWVVVAASFVVNLIADGITFSFGVIFVEFLKYFGESKSKTSWIGSLFMAMPLLSGPIASFLTDRYGCRKVTIVGGMLASAGFVISSFTNSIEVLFLTFGVLSGFGLSLCYVASVVIVAYYFDTKRSFATGLAVCGSGIGTFIFAPLTQLLIDVYGWRGTTLILAGIFLNLIVCGALMRDLPWTKLTKKKERKERKRKRRAKRRRNGSTADTYSVSNSTNTASVMQPVLENGENDDEKEENESNRLCNSLVNLPTYVHNGEKVPMEVLELLSTHKNVYNVLMQNYPELLAPSRSFSDSARLNEAHLIPNTISPPLNDKPPPPPPSPTPSCMDTAYVQWLNRNQITPPRMNQQKKLPTAYLKDLRLHRLSLTYRGAMLNINRYRLRASSCPDIYRNSMTTIAKETLEWYSVLWDFWDLLVDIIDFSHFTDRKFLLFAISNFILYAWYDVPYVYLTDNAIEMGFPEKDASFLVSLIGIVNMFGEIILGWAGDRPNINAGLIYAACMGLCGVIISLVPLIKSYWGLCMIAGLFGMFIAANYSLTCIILVELITLERFTNAYGLLLLVQGIANLIGPPLAGWIYDVTGTYDLSFYLAGIFIVLSGLLLVIIPGLKRYRKFQTLQRNLLSEEDAMKDEFSSDPKFLKILSACVTGRVKKKEDKKEENHV